MRDFSAEFRAELWDLMRWRRDVRRFRTDPVPEALLQEALKAFSLAPSVGLSEPWRIVRLDSTEAREMAALNFEAANARALEGYEGEKAAKYAGLKLSGMRQAPIQLAIFCDDYTPKGSGLGAQTMPEARRYSVVSALMLFWLQLRSHGIGLGWVSILDVPEYVDALDVPKGWTFVGHLCLGYPEDTHDSPELQRYGWEKKAKSLEVLTR